MAALTGELGYSGNAYSASSSVVLTKDTEIHVGYETRKCYSAWIEILTADDILVAKIPFIHQVRPLPIFGKMGQKVRIAAAIKARDSWLKYQLIYDEGIAGDANSGAGRTASVTITRPTNVTPYTAGDVVGGLLQFDLGSSPGASLKLLSSSLRLDLLSVPAGMGAFDLHLYSETPASVLLDNDAWTWPTGDRPMYLGKCTFVLPVDLGTGLWSKTDNINSMLRSTGDNIYGYLVTVAGYTPANNSEVYVPTLYCTQV